MSSSLTASEACIELEGVRVNNLRHVSLRIRHESLTVICGLSGSGKSSLAFDTLYAEGQRRYVETFSPAARQFLERIERPAADRITGLPPAVAIHQSARGDGPRSTVGSRTEILDALQTLFSHCSTPYCPACGIPVCRHSPATAAAALLRDAPGARLLLGFTLAKARGGPPATAEFWLQRGITRCLVNSRVTALDQWPQGSPLPSETIFITDRLKAEPGQASRLEDAAATAMQLADTLVALSSVLPSASAVSWSTRFDLNVPTAARNSVTTPHRISVSIPRWGPVRTVAVPVVPVMILHRRCVRAAAEHGWEHFPPLRGGATQRFLKSVVWKPVLCWPGCRLRSRNFPSLTATPLLPHFAMPCGDWICCVAAVWSTLHWNAA